MKRLILAITSLALAILSAVCAEPKPSDILDRASQAFRNAGGIEASFSMTADGHKSDGTLNLSGDNFKLSSPNMTFWYDGSSQWTYNPDIREVNITEPTPEELAETNPFVIISAFRMNYEAKRMPSAKGTYRIDLTPKHSVDSSVKRAILTIDSTTYMPSDIALTFEGDQTVAIHINSLVSGKNYTSSTFVFNSKLYPKAEIVDLR